MVASLSALWLSVANARLSPRVEGAEDEDSLVFHVHPDDRFAALWGHDSSDDGGRCASRLVLEEDDALVAQELADFFLNFLKSLASSGSASACVGLGLTRL